MAEVLLFQTWWKRLDRKQKNFCAAPQVAVCGPRPLGMFRTQNKCLFVVWCMVHFSKYIRALELRLQFRTWTILRCLGFYPGFRKPLIHEKFDIRSTIIIYFLPYVSLSSALVYAPTGLDLGLVDFQDIFKVLNCPWHTRFLLDSAHLPSFHRGFV